MQKILISACLMGQPVRYNGRDCLIEDDLLRRWRESGRLVPICPEVAGGLGIPRPAAEIDKYDGERVWEGGARVRTTTGLDVTRAFVQGAEAALRLAQHHQIRMAVLKERSPSCGTRFIYDGSFQGRLVDGSGVTAALLNRHGITTFGEDRLQEAALFLAHLENRD